MQDSKFIQLENTALLYSTLQKEGLQAEDVLVIDEKVAQLWGHLWAKHNSANILILASGEHLKSWDQLKAICEFVLSREITRHHKIIAIGGGSLSDVTGLAASIILRGLQWWVLPTTLLAQVDAAIGGKTSINTILGKNLIGTFYLPEKIFLLDEMLTTLPRTEIISGRGEILKYSFLSQHIAAHICLKSTFSQIVMDCSQFKQAIIVQDPFDLGIRQQLNLGHTIGHALEKQYHLAHGMAVAYGIYFKIHFFVPELESKFWQFCDYLDIPLDHNLIKKFWHERDQWWHYLLQDKKRISKKELKLILPLREGGFELRSFSSEQLLGLELC